ncbi:MAG: type II toxin-antitoxin system RelE/ParE family toxin [Opitutales bacterium]|nr:type II toxin-antitoxin system RelE/ParE family toxin [Opitutales bacterium]
METSFKRAFARDLRKIPHQKREKIEEFVFETVPQAESTEDLSPIVALSGHIEFYRKRFGDYRVGFGISEGKVIFYRALHRKEIYKRFP